MAGERAWLNRVFDILESHEPLSETELNKLIAEMNKFVEKDKKLTAKEYYQSKYADANFLKSATERLVNVGYPQDKLTRFSPLQIVMADDFMQYRVIRDDMMKWSNLPLSEVQSNAFTPKVPPGIIVEFIPHTLKVMQARARMQQRIDLLRIEEGIRAYAAANDNKLPASLDQIKLPLPIDPISGKSYSYELKEHKAVVHGTVPADRVNDRSYNRVLEIKIVKP
jgi:hypothetical protein